MSDFLPITLDDQIGCVQREIEMRHKVYQRLVRTGGMSAHKADLEIRIMEAVLETLREVQRHKD